MTTPPVPTMPMGAKAAEASAPANLLPPMPSGGMPPPMPAIPPAGAGMAPPAAPMGMPSFPAPSEPVAPPYQTRTQADGTIAIVWPSPDGDPSKDIISQVYNAPKVPQALQPKPAAAQ